MENRIASTPAQLLPQLAEAIPGVTTYAVTLGLPADMATTMTTQETALQTSHNQYLDKVEELNNSQAAKRTAMKVAQAMITLVRANAKPTLGPKYSQSWATLGFAGSLRVPRTVPGLVSLLGTMAGRLTTHPQFGGENFDAAQAELLRDNLTAAVNAVNVKKSEVRAKYNDRAGHAAAVRLSLRTVLSACRLKFDPLDGRWAEFGFNRPGAEAVPPAPVDVTVTLFGANGLLVKWPAVPRAEQYRLWLMVVGQDTELVPITTTTELEIVRDNLPSNATVHVALSAMNNGGEGVKSAPVIIQTQ